MIRSARILLALGIALGLAGSARADLYPGPGQDPEIGGGGSGDVPFYIQQSIEAWPGRSWTAPLLMFSRKPVDLLAVRITSGDPFSEPAFMYFSASGWSEVLNEGDLAVASGQGTRSMLFFLGFSGSMHDPVEFDIVAYSGDMLVGSVHGSWNGVVPWIHFTSGQWNPGRSDLMQSAAPAPGATALAVLGLGLIGVIRRRLA